MSLVMFDQGFTRTTRRLAVRLPIRGAEYTYAGHRCVYMLSHCDSVCDICKDEIEEGEEAVFVPKPASKRERFMHPQCAAPKIRRKNDR